MTAERWNRLKELFEAALEHAPSERPSYLARSCPEDKVLLDEALLLVKNHELAGAFLEAAAVHGEEDRVFSPGQFAAGRFEIIRFLGVGGMGEVYEAEDRDLGERIALKTLRPEISGDPRSVTRLLQEIQLARRVTHPNVCRMFDLARHSSQRGEILFITMELLRGETLAERLRRSGRMLVKEALPIVRQMCHALEAAHQAGIVHRDFKCGNVMVAEGAGGTLRTVVMDFGLARTTNPAGAKLHSLTGTGNLIGTLAYMAPEQLDSGEATFLSDIYALGVVMYEMAVGEKPFEAKDLLLSSLRRARGAPTPPHEIAPDVDRRWEKVILRCLEPTPQDRFPCIGEILEALGSSGVAAQRWSRRKTIITGCAASLALLLAGLRIVDWRAGIQEGSSVLLMEIDNTTADQELDAVTEVLRVQLEQSGHFNVIERSRIRQVLKQMGRSESQPLDGSVGREVAWRAHSPLIIFGGVSRVGSGFVLNLKLERIAGKPVSAGDWNHSFPAENKRQLLASIDEGSKWIRKIAGEVSPDSAGLERPPQDTTTDSWEALLLYAHAEKLQGINQTQEAILLLRDAVRVDPRFALAWMRLGDLSNSLGKESDGFLYWIAALDAMKRRPLTRHEELRIRGLFAADSGDYTKAESTFRTFEVLYPHDYLPTFYLAGALIDTGRSDEALAKLNEASRKRPESYVVVARTARLNLTLGRLEAAVRDLAGLRALGRNETADLIEAEAAFVRGNYAQTDSLLRGLLGSQDGNWRSRGSLILACYLAERGKYRDAIRLLRDHLQFDTNRGLSAACADKQLALAYLLYRKGERAECRKACQAALAEERGRRHVVRAGTLLARAGYPRDAASALDNLGELLVGPIFEAARHRVRGEILLANRQTTPALAELRSADSIMPPVEVREFLARALAISGQTKEAAAAYRQIAVAPARIWQAPDLDPPGLWADGLFQSARLAQEAGFFEEGRQFLVRYLDVRQEADVDFAEAAEARRMLG